MEIKRLIGGTINELSNKIDVLLLRGQISFSLVLGPKNDTLLMNKPCKLKLSIHRHYEYILITPFIDYTISQHLLYVVVGSNKLSNLTSFERRYFPFLIR